MIKKTSTLLTLALCSLHGVAEEDQKSLTTDLELGFISTSGNTETTSLKGRVNIKQDLEHFRNTYVAEALYKEDEVTVDGDGEETTETQTTAEKYFLSAQSDFKLDEEYKGIFLFGSYEQDEFSSFDYQATLAVGYSDRLFTRENSYLGYSIGPGVAFNKERDTGESNSIGILRVSGEYFLKLSENAKFTQVLSSEIPYESGENRKTKSETALTANITQGLALKASFVVDHNSEVSEGIEKSDTQTAVTVVYSF